MNFSEQIRAFCKRHRRSHKKEKRHRHRHDHSRNPNPKILRTEPGSGDASYSYSRSRYRKFHKRGVNKNNLYYLPAEYYWRNYRRKERSNRNHASLPKKPTTSYSARDVDESSKRLAHSTYNSHPTYDELMNTSSQDEVEDADNRLIKDVLLHFGGVREDAGVIDLTHEPGDPPPPPKIDVLPDDVTCISSDSDWDDVETISTEVLNRNKTLPISNKNQKEDNVFVNNKKGESIQQKAQFNNSPKHASDMDIDTDSNQSPPISLTHIDTEATYLSNDKLAKEMLSTAEAKMMPQITNLLNDNDKINSDTTGIKDSQTTSDRSSVINIDTSATYLDKIIKHNKNGKVLPQTTTLSNNTDYITLDTTPTVIKDTKSLSDCISVTKIDTTATYLEKISAEKIILNPKLPQTTNLSNENDYISLDTTGLSTSTVIKDTQSLSHRVNVKTLDTAATYLGNASNSKLVKKIPTPDVLSQTNNLLKDEDNIRSQTAELSASNEAHRREAKKDSKKLRGSKNLSKKFKFLSERKRCPHFKRAASLINMNKPRPKLIRRVSLDDAPHNIAGKIDFESEIRKSKRVRDFMNMVDDREVELIKFADFKAQHMNNISGNKSSENKKSYSVNYSHRTKENSKQTKPIIMKFKKRILAPPPSSSDEDEPPKKIKLLSNELIRPSNEIRDAKKIKSKEHFKEKKRDKQYKESSKKVRKHEYLKMLEKKYGNIHPVVRLEKLDFEPSMTSSTHISKVYKNITNIPKEDKKVAQNADVYNFSIDSIDELFPTNSKDNTLTMSITNKSNVSHVTVIKSHSANSSDQSRKENIVNCTNWKPKGDSVAAPIHKKKKHRRHKEQKTSSTTNKDRIKNIGHSNSSHRSKPKTVTPASDSTNFEVQKNSSMVSSNQFGQHYQNIQIPGLSEPVVIRVLNTTPTELPISNPSITTLSNFGAAKPIHFKSSANQCSIPTKINAPQCTVVGNVSQIAASSSEVAPKIIQDMQSDITQFNRNKAAMGNSRPMAHSTLQVTADKNPIIAQKQSAPQFSNKAYVMPSDPSLIAAPNTTPVNRSTRGTNMVAAKLINPTTINVSDVSRVIRSSPAVIPSVTGFTAANVAPNPSSPTTSAHTYPQTTAVSAPAINPTLVELSMEEFANYFALQFIQYALQHGGMKQVIVNLQLDTGLKDIVNKCYNIHMTEYTRLIKKLLREAVVIDYDVDKLFVKIRLALVHIAKPHIFYLLMVFMAFVEVTTEFGFKVVNSILKKCNELKHFNVALYKSAAKLYAPLSTTQRRVLQHQILQYNKLASQTKALDQAMNLRASSVQCHKTTPISLLHRKDTIPPKSNCVPVIQSIAPVNKASQDTTSSVPQVHTYVAGAPERLINLAGSHSQICSDAGNILLSSLNANNYQSSPNVTFTSRAVRPNSSNNTVPLQPNSKVGTTCSIANRSNSNAHIPSQSSSNSTTSRLGNGNAPTLLDYIISTNPLTTARYNSNGTTTLDNSTTTLRDCANATASFQGISNASVSTDKVNATTTLRNYTNTSNCLQGSANAIITSRNGSNANTSRRDSSNDTSSLSSNLSSTTVWDYALRNSMSSSKAVQGNANVIITPQNGSNAITSRRDSFNDTTTPLGNSTVTTLRDYANATTSFQGLANASVNTANENFNATTSLRSYTNPTNSLQASANAIITPGNGLNAITPRRDSSNGNTIPTSIQDCANATSSFQGLTNVSSDTLAHKPHTSNDRTQLETEATLQRSLYPEHTSLTSQSSNQQALQEDEDAASKDDFRIRLSKENLEYFLKSQESNCEDDLICLSEDKMPLPMLFKCERQEFIDFSDYQIIVESSKDLVENIPRIPSVDSGILSPKDEIQTSINICICGVHADLICECRTAVYCSEDCQKIDWANHQLICTSQVNASN